MDLQSIKKEAKSATITPQRLSELAGFPNAGVRLAVAKNPRTQTATLEILARRAEINTLKAVAGHGNTPLHLLDKLLNHQHPSVRKAVVSSGKLTVSQVELLVLDSDVGVLRELMYRHGSRISPALFRQLCRHPDQATRQFAHDYGWHRKMFASEFTEALLLEGLIAPQQNVFKDATPELLEVFADSQSEQVRLWVASSRSAPAQVLTQLSLDQSWDVRREVASNNNTPPEVLAALAHDGAIEVRNRLVANSRLSTEVLAVLATDEDSGVRYWVAQHRSVNRDILERLAQDSNDRVREQALRQQRV